MQLKRMVGYLTATFFVLYFSGCAHKLIPETGVNNTKENRSVVAFMERYRLAMESRDIENVMALVAPDYYEDKSFAEEPMVYARDEAEERLSKVFEHIKVMKLTFNVQRISRPKLKKKGQDLLEVVYHYNENIQTKLPAGEEWKSFADVNMIMLRVLPKNKGYEIVSGL